MRPTRGRPLRPKFQHLADEDRAVVFAGELGTAWNQIITLLMERGYTFHDATLWAMAREPSRADAALAAHADTYRAVGFMAAHAVEWFCSGIHAVDAAAYANRGWTPAQAALLRRMLHDADPHDGPRNWSVPYTEPHDAEAWWLFTGIPPGRALRYVAAGYSDREAASLERNWEAGDVSVDAAVDLLVALRRREPAAADASRTLARPAVDGVATQ